MIIVQLKGGLGNQMFQYALVRHLAHCSGEKLVLDISWYKRQSLRQYGLDNFNIEENFLSEAAAKELNIEKFGEKKIVLRRLFNKFRKRDIKHIKEKKKFQFNSEILEFSRNVYLDGSWQNEKYFRDIRKIIISEFSAKKRFEKKNQELAGQITECRSVGLHVRRGDYVENPRTKETHGTCGMDYFRDGVKFVTERVPDAKFFIYSDDYQWVHEQFAHTDQFVFIKNSPENLAHEDLLLMSLCKHNIISNSTYSWWGAWLNQSPEKIVIAPNRWIKDPAYNANDILPNGWVRL